MLQEIGYVNTKVYSNSDCVVLPNRQVYCKFVKTVVMKPYLDHLSSDNYDSNIDKLKKAMFSEVFLDQVDKRSNKSDTRWFLDFVRLDPSLIDFNQNYIYLNYYCIFDVN